MAKLKSIVFVAGVMLLILAAAVGYLSIKYLVSFLQLAPPPKRKGERFVGGSALLKKKKMCVVYSSVMSCFVMRS